MKQVGLAVATNTEALARPRNGETLKSPLLRAPADNDDSDDEFDVASDDLSDEDEVVDADLDTPDEDDAATLTVPALSDESGDEDDGSGVEFDFLDKQDEDEQEWAEQGAGPAMSASALDAHLSKNLNADLLNAKEEQHYGLLARQGDEKAKLAMFTANLRLVVRIASRYRHSMGNATSMEDLIAEGNIGLLRAIELFEPERGFRFSTYATNWIRQHITRYLSNNARLVRWPVGVVQLYNRYRKMVVEAEGRGMIVSDEEAIEKLETTESLFFQMKSLNQSAVSGDQPLGSDGESSSTLMDVQSDERHDLGPDSFSRGVQSSELSVLFARYLTDKESYILRCRFGMGVDERTLDDIGHVMGLTRERIRQIESIGLRKLRRAMRLEGLQLADFLPVNEVDDKDVSLSD